MNREEKAPLTTDGPLELVNLIDALIRNRIDLGNSCDSHEIIQLREQGEIIRRQMTDYFLQIDPRKGVYHAEITKVSSH